MRTHNQTFPPGTFIPTPARITAIIHLCLGFTLLITPLFDAFFGAHFRVKSETLYFESVMHDTDHLPKKDQEILFQAYDALQRDANKPITEKLKESLIGIFRFSPFVLLWMILSISIPIMLLKKVEGAKEAAWLLPLLMACVFFFQPSVNSQTMESKLFPSESYLIENYSDGPLSSSITEQHHQLKEAWNAYLLDRYSPSLEEAARRFNTEWLLARIQDKAANSSSPYPVLAFLGLLWSLFFVLFINRKGALHA